MRRIKLILAAAMLPVLAAGCGWGDDDTPAAVVTPPPPVEQFLATLGIDGETFADAATEVKYEVQKVGIVTSGNTLRLPLGTEIVDVTFPYIWVANSGEGTISKLRVSDGAELGRYRTGPGNGNPSRTTVDQDGNVWVGNRNNNTITKVGLLEFGQCVDRNGDGAITTSTGGTDVKDWSGTFGDGLGATNAADECILLHVALTAPGVTTPFDIRTVAIDPQNNVFVGGFSQSSLFKVDGRTGAILKAVDSPLMLQSHYGGVVDKAGNLWSMSSGSGKVQKINADMTTAELIDIGHTGYGIGIDKFGKIWTTEYGTRFSAFDPADPVGTLKVFSQTNSFAAQGIASDDNGDIFIAGSLGGNIVGHYRQTFDTSGAWTGAEFVANYTVGSGPTGVAVDSVGAVWATNNNDSTVSRITLAADPANAVVDTFPVGQSPYNYSDMTGRVVRTITNRQGTWEATFDGGEADFAWTKIVWTFAQALPDKTAATFEIKTANDKVSLGALDYVEVQNDTELTGVVGRYLKLRVRLTSESDSVTPEVASIGIK